MKMVAHVRLAVSLGCIGAIATATGIADDRNYQDSWAAEIVWRSIHVSQSSNFHDLGSDAQTVVAQSGSLGLLWLSRSRTNRSRIELAYLSFARLDGAYGEEHQCYVLAESQRIVGLLSELNANEYKRFCALQASKGFKCEELTPAMRRVSGYLQSIRSGTRCAK
jgi:hypothetical protein